MYRNYKKFEESAFLSDVKNANFNCDTEDPNLNYENLVNVFRSIVNKHAPLKQKTVRGNEAPFMNKKLRKAIYTRSRLKNRYNKNPTNENKILYKKQRNKCVNLRKKAIKIYFNNITKSGIIENKKFWQTIKPFITNKSGLSNNNIMLVEKDSLITKDEEIANILNDHYINIVEKSSGIKPSEINYDKVTDKRILINNIIEKFCDNPSIINIKNENSDIFVFQKINESEIIKIFKELNTNTSTGEDKIPTKLVKLAKNHLVKPLKEAINSSIISNIFPNKAKRAAVTPLDKGGKDKTNITNYRPISVLNVFSKFYEKIMKEQIMSFMESKFSPFLSAYRKSYSTQQVLIRLIEEWKNKLDKNYVVGAVLMDLSKAFDCIPHDLIIAKLSAYGFDQNSLEFILSYLTNREQSTRVNGIYSLFQLILTGVPQGSILGPIIFNIFINDLFYFIVNSELHNYADDNTISAFSNSIPHLIEILEKETNIAISWLTKNKMIANSEKFHSIILTKNKDANINLNLKIGNKTIQSEQHIKLLGVKVDNKLNFDKHIYKLCKQSSAQLNAISKFKNILPRKVKSVLIQSFIYANFNYCPLVWHFSHAKALLKIEMIQKRSLRLLLNDTKKSYEDLLTETNKSPMNINRLRSLCIEIYKTINGLNPSFMKNIFRIKENNRPVRSNNANNLELKITKTITFGTNSLSSLGPKIWNSLPYHLKYSKNISTFKQMIKNWDGCKCQCDDCN